MTSFHENDVAHVAAALMGGPLDGKRFRVPMPPGFDLPPNTLSIPLTQPATHAPLAIYGRQGADAVGNEWVYIFEDCVSPNGERLMYALPHIGFDQPQSEPASQRC